MRSSPGGGYGVRYTMDDPDTRPADMAREVARIVAEAARRHGFADPLPDLTIEPGRSIIAPAGVALYRVGSVKHGARTYVAVDGGMADNIRPTAYGAKYTAVLASRVSGDDVTDVAVAGKYCETGDILIQRHRAAAAARRRSHRGARVRRLSAVDGEQLQHGAASRGGRRRRWARAPGAKA